MAIEEMPAPDEIKPLQSLVIDDQKRVSNNERYMTVCQNFTTWKDPSQHLTLEQDGWEWQSWDVRSGCLQPISKCSLRFIQDLHMRRVPRTGHPDPPPVKLVRRWSGPL